MKKEQDEETLVEVYVTKYYMNHAADRVGFFLRFGRDCFLSRELAEKDAKRRAARKARLLTEELVRVQKLALEPKWEKKQK